MLETSNETNLEQIEKSQISDFRRPEVFSYTNYRSFLRDSYEYLSPKPPAFSETAFIRKAGYGANSRGYLSLLIKGKRNLSSKKILGFAHALKLNEKETGYFESLVLFNQAKSDQDQSYYFSKLSKAIKGKRSYAYEVLKSQYNYYSKWYLVAIRELVVLEGFVEDPAWIRRALKSDVSKKEISEALEDLLRLELITRNEQGRLIQTTSLTRFSDNADNFKAVLNIQRQFLEKSKESLEDDYEKRSASSVVLAIKKEDFSKIREDIAAFRSQILKKYAIEDKELDDVVALNIQFFHLTDSTQTEITRIKQ